MASEIRVNKINNRAGLGTVTYTDTGIIVSGVSTATNFKTGSSNLHSTGLTVGDTFVHSTGVNGSSMDVDDFISVGSNIHLGNAGVITATSFSGSGANLTGIDATALKDPGGDVIIQAQDSGAVFTGIHTFTTSGTTLDGSGIKVSTGATISNVGNASFTGIVTALSFRGDGSQLSGVVQSDTPAGSSTSSSIFFEVDTGVSISTTTTLSRASSNPGKIFTKVKEIIIGTSSPSSVELIVDANEELIVDFFDQIT